MTIPQVSKSQTTVDNTNGYTHRELHNAVATAVNTLETEVAQNTQDINTKQNILTAGNGLDIVSDVISAHDGSDSQRGIVQTDGITTKIVGGKLTATVCDCTETTLNGILKGDGEHIGVATPDVDYLTPNSAITGATKTKITYDAKGLVTSGADLAYTDLPIATSSTVGAVKPDNNKIVVDENGVLSIQNTGGDVNGPATNSADYIPQWDGANSKLLKNGIPTSTFATAAQGSLADTAIQVETDPTVPAWAKEATKPSYTASEVGLGNVDNTSDLDKPVSTATQSALDLKENLLPETPENPETKYLNGLKQWAAIAIGSGGYAANLYLTTVNSTDVTGYKQVKYTNDASETTISQTVKASEELMVAYLFDQALGATTIDSGSWRTSLFGAIDAAAGDSWFKFEVFVYHTDTTETVLFSQYSGLIENRVGYEGYQRITIESVQPLFTVLATDRLGVKIYAKTTAAGDRTLYYKVGDGNASYCNTPLALRHSQLRGLNDDTNYQHITSTEKSTYAGKQDALVSGTNIKTINGSSVLGSGNLAIIGVDVTTKGDLETHNGTSSTRLGVGTDGQVLVARSGETTGLKWEDQSGSGSNSFVINETPSGTVNGSTVAFDTAHNYVAGSIQVYRDGQLLAGGGADYTETDANTITFTTAPVTGSVLLVSYQQSVTTSGNADTLDGLHASSFQLSTGSTADVLAVQVFS